MARARMVEVFVCDKDGYGLSGYKVALYGGDPVWTDRNGTASLLTESDRVSVYVNGRTAYEGSVSNMPSPLVWKIT